MGASVRPDGVPGPVNSQVPTSRIRNLNEAAPRPEGEFVLYWMVANRRPRWNFALQHAVVRALEFDRPLVVLEALGCRHRWANDRSHRFVLDGMADNADAFRDTPVQYHPYVEPEPGAARGLIEALGRHACIVITDDWPCFLVPKVQAAAARQLRVPLEAVDASCIVPMGVAERSFSRAHAFRRFLHGCLAEHLAAFPAKNPLARRRLKPAAPLPSAIRKRWTAPDVRRLRGSRLIGELPIDHRVVAVDEPGGWRAGSALIPRFIKHRLDRYVEDGRHPDFNGTSRLSPYLHFGHVSAHEAVDAVLTWEDRFPEDLPERGDGRRSGWWGLGDAAEAFLDQLITWRELGFNMCVRSDDYDQYESLPDWARKTLEEHAGDAREHVYTLEEFDRGGTHDELWNAAQRELRESGRMHNYLRMLWGKKILEWTERPQEALQVMLELNNRYALDGRDPNSYSGIFWTLGRFDRAWGPERPVYGKIRYMTSENTRRKLRLREYLARWGEPAPNQQS
jgi:deoxyribodipyrimidine photo-lyase